MWMANYWRRFFNVDEIHDEQQGPEDDTDPATPADWTPMPDQSEFGADPEQMPYTTSHGHLPIPIHLVQMAWVLDSMLSQVDPAQHPEVAHLRQRLTSGSIRDFSSLNFQELTDLGTVLALTAHQLARQAEQGAAAHEVALPSASDEGL